MSPQKIIFGAAILALVLMGAPQNLRSQPAPNADASVAPDDSQPAPEAALPADILPDSPLAQVVRLAQSGVDESVILSYINNSGSPFNLTSDQIIYLKDLGLPDDAVTAMIQRDQQLGATTTAQPPAVTTSATATEAPAEQPAEVTQNYFYDTLSPYGAWVNVEGYGLCWRPTVVVYNSGWQPYCEHGHWVYTDAGWFWLSDYSWGACTFHYGRWFHNARYGWCWWPDTTWGPSWVCWRYSNDYCGWAPLPPHAIFRPGVGMVFNGAVVGANFNFGISANFFTFVPTKNFCDPHPARFRVKRDKVVPVFNHTTVINNFNEDSRNHFIVNRGIAPDRISAVSKAPIHTIAIRETTGGHGDHFEGNGATLVVNHPHFSGNAAATLNQGERPKVVQQKTPRSFNVGGQNNFSQHGNNQNNHLQPNVVTPQNIDRGQQNRTSQNIQRVNPPSQEPSRIIGAPVSPTPQDNHSKSQTPGYDRAMSPRLRQQFEQSPHPETPAQNDRQQSNERTIENSDAHPQSPPQTGAPNQSAPPSDQHSDRNRDRNGQ